MDSVATSPASRPGRDTRSARRERPARPQAPLPVRNGVSPTKLRLPLEGPWHTVAEYMLTEFRHLTAEALYPRFDRDEVRAADGTALSRDTPLGVHEFIWYYRDVANEPAIPFPITVLHHDEHLVVADKPHFLSTLPGGKYVQHTALVRLRNMLDIPELVPLHRLDRATAGLLMFSPNPETRGAYQVMFENRQIHRTYEAVGVLPEAPGEGLNPLLDRFPLVYRNRIIKEKGVVTSVVESYGPEVSGRLEAPRTGRQRRRTDPTTGPNAQTRIELLATGAGAAALGHAPVAHFRLHPHTGRTHQLRIHLAALGVPIAHDRFYPDLLDDAPDDFDRPLQLLASGIGFTDPLTGRPRRFYSQLRLQEAPNETPDEDSNDAPNGVGRV